MFNTQVNEWYNFPGSAYEANQTGPLGDLPFVVIAAGTSFMLDLSFGCLLVWFVVRFVCLF
jgi:hypothetical protein